MKKRWKQFRQWICSITGHWFSHIDTIIFKIKTNELNNDMSAKLTCRCCGDIFVHKASPEAECNQKPQ